jgi:hypothetical protein
LEPNEKGGRDNAKMVTKALLQALSMPAKDGNYFLRPDRILAAFVLPANEPLRGYLEAKRALDSERHADEATKKRLGKVQEGMAASGDDLRRLHEAVRSGTETPNSIKTTTANTTSGWVGCSPTASQGHILGDVELTSTEAAPNGQTSRLHKAFASSNTPRGNLNYSGNILQMFDSNGDSSSTQSERRPAFLPTSQQATGCGGGDHDHDESNEHELRKSEHVLRQSMNFRSSQSSNAAAGARRKSARSEPMHQPVAAGSDVDGGSEATDWAEILDTRTDMPYYHNRKTGETTWKKPQHISSGHTTL